MKWNCSCPPKKQCTLLPTSWLGGKTTLPAQTRCSELEIRALNCKCSYQWCAFLTVLPALRTRDCNSVQFQGLPRQSKRRFTGQWPKWQSRKQRRSKHGSILNLLTFLIARWSRKQHLVGTSKIAKGDFHIILTRQPAPVAIPCHFWVFGDHSSRKTTRFERGLATCDQQHAKNSCVSRTLASWWAVFRTN